MTFDPLINRESFHIDRWRGSRALLLPERSRGLYREVLTASWHERATLPTDLTQLRKLVLYSEEAWEDAWPAIASYFHLVEGRLVNPQQQEIFRAEEARWARATARAQAAARRRWGR